ncbi:unnamed protein product [Ixodes hexagonus]
MCPLRLQRRHNGARPGTTTSAMPPLRRSWWGRDSGVDDSRSTILTVTVVESTSISPATFHFSRVTPFTSPKDSKARRMASTETPKATQWIFTFSSRLSGSTIRHRRSFTCNVPADKSFSLASTVWNLTSHTWPIWKAPSPAMSCLTPAWLRGPTKSSTR